MKNRFKIKILIGAAVSAVMIYLAASALGGLNPMRIFSVHIDWWFFVLSAALFSAGQFMRIFVYPFGIDRRLTFGQAARIVLVGNMANMLLPLKLGEGFRFAFFPKRYSMPHRTRLLAEPAAVDFVVILLLSVLAIPLTAGNMHPLTVHTLTVAGLVLAGAAAVFTVAYLLFRQVRRWVKRYLTPAFMRMLGWVFCSWVLILLSNWAGLMAFSYLNGQAMALAFAVFATSNLILFIPSSPGGLGLFEYAVVLSLRFFHVAEPAAVPIALFLHLVQYAVLLPMGLIAYLAGLRSRAALAQRETQ